MPTTRAARSCALVAALAVAPAASAVITAHPLERPDNGFIGRWNGSSAVAIGEHWVLTARHVGGNRQDRFRMRQVEYRPAETFRHDSVDLMLIRMIDPLPGWHDLELSPQRGEAVLLGGMGRTAGSLAGPGLTWGGINSETWGANVLEQVGGTFLAIDFDWGSPSGAAAATPAQPAPEPSSGGLYPWRRSTPPASSGTRKTDDEPTITGPAYDLPANPGAVAHEAGFAVYDSGGGLFTFASDGSLDLAGIAVSVSGWGATVQGNQSYAVSVAAYAGWIFDTIAAAESGAIAPVEPEPFDLYPFNRSTPEPASGMLLAAGLLALGRRRR